jgi:hypothetical protein
LKSRQGEFGRKDENQFLSQQNNWRAEEVMRLSNIR